MYFTRRRVYIRYNKSVCKLDLLCGLAHKSMEIVAVSGYIIQSNPPSPVSCSHLQGLVKSY